MSKKAESKKGIKEEIQIPEGIQVSVEGTTIKVKKGDVELEKKFVTTNITFKQADNKIQLTTKKSKKYDRKMTYTAIAHIKNMLKGVSEKHVYKLKICSGHFPMNVAVSGDKFTIKNFLGEAVPRTIKILPGVSVKINGTEVLVESNNLELAGQTAANIETLTKIKGRDSRIFQDGIYIVEKDGDVL